MAEVTLTWKEHHNNLCGMFEKLLEEGALVDCTLAAEGRYVNVHKTILSAVSPYFELIFTQESENNPIIILTDIKFQELKAMIDFIYRGKVNVPEEFLNDFVCAAESLQIKGLGIDYIKNQKQNGTAMTYAKEPPNHMSCIPLNQHLVNVVSGNENSGTATPSSLKVVDEDMDFEGHSAISSQTDPLNSCRINLCSTSANVVDNSISSGLSHRESDSISTSNSLCLETCELKHEPTSEEEVKMEFVECEEEYVEEDASRCWSPSETTCKSTSSSRLVTAGGSNAPNQSTSSVGEFEKPDQELLGPVSSLQQISFLQQIGCLSVSTLPSTSGIDKGLEIDTDDVKPRTEFSESSYIEFATEESAFESQTYTSEAAGAEGEVDVEEVMKEEAMKEEAEDNVEANMEDVEANMEDVEANMEDVEANMEDVEANMEDVEANMEDVEANMEDVEANIEDVEAEGAPSLAGVECGKVFGDASQPSVHARTHAAERSNACHVCGKDCKYPSFLTRHLRIHTGERPFVCAVCGKDFQSKEDLKRHLRSHTGERPFPCPSCGKAFAVASGLKEHLRIHTGERPFVCSTCGKAFANVTTLKQHLRIHTGERPFVCPTCGKAFAHGSTLKQHLRIHTAERPFACEVCGKAFNTTGDLTRHLRTHTRERPFVCDMCGKDFHMKADLKRHLHTHSGERPFTCEVCGKAFQRKAQLEVHLRIHTGERPYVCPTCGKGFRQVGALARHQRTHARVSPSTPVSTADSPQQAA